jgi:hypothetical protein
MGNTDFHEFRYKINIFSSKSTSLRIKNTKNVDIYLRYPFFFVILHAINQPNTYF